MSDKLVFHDRGYFLLGLLEGEYAAEDFARFSHEFEKAVNEFSGNLVLLDKTKFKSCFDYFDAVQFADSPISDFMVEKCLRIASVVCASNLEEEYSYETLMRNRSVNYRPFVVRREAEEWLMK